MTAQVARRIAALEALPAQERVRTPEEVQANWVADAARCGFTEEQVMARFGGWPEFAYAKMIGEVVDPAADTTHAAWNALLAKHGGDGMSAYMELLGVGCVTAR